MRGLVLVGVIACTPSRPVVPRVIPEPPTPRAPPEGLEPPRVRVETLPPPGGPQLPRDFVPVGYRARLVVGTLLEGHIEITGDVAAPTSKIWLHARDIDVVTATAKRDAETVALEVAYAHRDKQPEELLRLRAPKPLAPGRWVLSIDYRAKIVDHDPVELPPTYTRNWLDKATLGAFRETVDGKPYVFTQFESMFARRVFPCVDEPWNKVPWQLTLDVPKDDLAASNTPIVRETPLRDGWKRVELAPTPPLPTYLIAFAVGPFDIVDAGKAKSGMPIRFLVARGTAARFAVPVATTAAVLDRVEAWFQMPYPYVKLDVVAVPRMTFGGMEHPGLITFSALDENLDAPEWTRIIAHELAHQWFGNFVTPAWWDDIWLNESLATWLASKVVASIDPAWDRVWINPEWWGAPFAVRAPVADTADPGKLARYLWGWHGAQVIRMIEGFIGAEKMQRALLAYLRAHAHGTVTTADLVAAIDDAAGSKLDPIFADYLDRPGVPRVTAEVRCTGRHRLVLSLDEAWTTPVCFAYDKDGARERTCVIVDQRTKEVPLAGKACPRWVFPNADGDGFYKTGWGADALNAMFDRGWGALTRRERDELFAHVDDLLSDHRLAFALRLIDAGDDDSVAKAVPLLWKFAPLVPDDMRARFDSWIASRLGVRARSVPLDVDTRLDANSMTALMMLDLAARAHDPTITARAAELMAHLDKLEPFVSQIVLTIGARDPAVALGLLEDLARPTKRTSSSVIRALESQQSTIDVVAANPAKLEALPPPTRAKVLGGACDPARRDRALALLAGLGQSEGVSELHTRIDDCIKRRDQLAPAFRAWLKTAKP